MAPPCQLQADPSLCACRDKPPLGPRCKCSRGIEDRQPRLAAHASCTLPSSQPCRSPNSKSLGLVRRRVPGEAINCQGLTALTVLKMLPATSATLRNVRVPWWMHGIEGHATKVAEHGQG